MSISTILYTGQRALSTHQASIQVAGQNIANVNTPGYSRQRAELVSLQTTFNGGLLSGGVDVAQVTRAYDRFVTAQVNTANSRFNSALEQSDLLGQIESLFNDLNLEDSSLAQALDEFFNGFQDLANDPESLSVRTIILQRGEIVASAIQSHYHNLKEFRQTLNVTLNQELNQVNALVSQIADLNRHITQGAGTHTIQTNTLRDERDQLIKQLSDQIGVSTIETEEGSLTVLLQGGRPLVEGAHANHLVMQDHPDDPMQSLVYMQDDEGNQTNVTSLLTNGKLYGLLDIKDAFIPQVLGGLDRLAAQLTSIVNQQHSVGFGLDGTTGHNFFASRQVSGQVLASNAGGGELQSVAILDPTQLPLDDLRILFVSDGPPPQFDIVNDATGEMVAAGQTYASGAPIVFSGIEVVLGDSGGLPQSGDTFIIHTTAGSAQHLEVNPTLLNDTRQLAAAQTDSPGGNANALALANLNDEPILDGFTIGGFYSALLTGVGAASQLTTRLAEQEQLLLTEVENRRESISGVSLEEEQIDLIRFQQAFAAAAQLINVADELAQTVLSMAG